MNKIDASNPEIPRFENAEQAADWSAEYVATWNNARQEESAGLLGLEMAKISLARLYDRQEYFKVDGFLEKGEYNSPEWEAFLSEGAKLEDARFDSRAKVLAARKEIATMNVNGTQIVDENLDLFIEAAANEAGNIGVDIIV